MTLTERARELANRFRVSENGIHGKAILAALEETRREAIDDLMPIVKAARSLLQESDHGTTEAEISAWRHLRALLDPPDSKRPGTHGDAGPDAT